jgi:hypothetical protein
MRGRIPAEDVAPLHSKTAEIKPANSRTRSATAFAEPRAGRPQGGASPLTDGAVVSTRNGDKPGDASRRRWSVSRASTGPTVDAITSRAGRGFGLSVAGLARPLGVGVTWLPSRSTTRRCDGRKDAAYRHVRAEYRAIIP